MENLNKKLDMKSEGSHITMNIYNNPNVSTSNTYQMETIMPINNTSLINNNNLINYEYPDNIRTTENRNNIIIDKPLKESNIQKTKFSQSVNLYNNNINNNTNHNDNNKNYINNNIYNNNNNNIVKNVPILQNTHIPKSESNENIYNIQKNINKNNKVFLSVIYLPKVRNFNHFINS